MKNKIIAMLIVSLGFLGFTFDGDIDYSKYKAIEWSELKQIKVKTNIIDISGRIKLEEVVEGFIKEKNIFSMYEGCVVKKYSKEKFEGNLVIDSKKVIDDIDGFRVGRREYVGIRFADKYDNLVYFISPYIVVYDAKTNEDYPMFSVTNDIFKYESERFIDVKGEWVFVVAWQGELFTDKDSSKLDIMKFNIKTKTAEIFDSYDYGIFSQPYVEFHSYDISKDRRYIYIAGIDHVKEYMPEDYYNREEVKIEKGLYAYDWWENRLFKLVDRGINAVVNNTDDGYVYIRVGDYYDKKWHEGYYRFKNPEELLKKY